MYSNISMFDGSTPYKITKPVRLIELFAGIGAQAKALENLGIDFEHYRICEFDKYAVQSYNAIHGTNFKPSDITKINAEDLGIVETEKYEYIMTYSFPCTDLSIAGKQAGMTKGSGTRSGLLWEVEFLLAEMCGYKSHRVMPGKHSKLFCTPVFDDYTPADKTKLPQVLLMENVPQVLNSDFGAWLSFLEELGYHNYYEVLNAKDYGIPQNRDRCFMVSLLGDYYYDFPQPIPLELRLKDMLESNVDEKHYLSEKAIKGLNTHLERNKEKGNGFGWKPKDGNDIATTIKTEAGYRPDSNFIKEPHCLNSKVNGKQPSLCDRIYDSEYISTAITTSPFFMGKVTEPCCEVVAQLNITGRHESACRVRGHETRTVEEILAYPQESDTITADGKAYAFFGGAWCRIRKLTPKECWRLMGFTDSDFDKAKASGVSDSQLYKQAGNSIVVPVLEAIFKNLF